MHVLQTIVAVALGGAVGALGRYGIAELVRGTTPLPAYVGTLLANVVGCFLIGVAYAVLEGAGRPEWVRGLLVTGTLGAFTTFSTFSLEAMHLIDDRRLGELCVYVAFSVLVGLAACKAGVAVAGAGPG